MDAMEEDCLIYRKHRGEILTPGAAIFASDLVYAEHALIPEGQQDTFLGTLFVEPKRHVPELADLIAAEACAIGILVSHLSRALMDSGNVEHVYMFVFGHHVPHLHIWLLPRYAGTPREYWGTRVDEWPDAPRGGVNEIKALCDRLRETLQDAE